MCAISDNCNIWHINTATAEDNVITTTTACSSIYLTLRHQLTDYKGSANNMEWDRNNSLQDISDN